MAVAAVGEDDVGVAGYRDRHGPRVRSGRHVQQDDRVGVQLALVHPGPQLRQQLGRERVPRGVRAAVEADEQCRERLLRLQPGRCGVDDVAGDHAAAQLAVQRPAVAGADEQREREHRGDPARDHTRDPAYQVGGPVHPHPVPDGPPAREVTAGPVG